MFVIGMCGAKRSGKDFGATILIETLERQGFKVVRTSFGAHLRHVTKQFFNCTDKDLEEDKDVMKTYRFVPSQFDMIMSQNGINVLAVAQIESRFMEKLADSGLQRVDVYEDRQHRAMAVQATGRNLLRTVGQLFRSYAESYWVDAALIHPDFSEKTVVVVTDVRMLNEAQKCHYLLEVNGRNVERDGHVTEQELPRRLISFTIQNNFDKSYELFLRTASSTIVARINQKFRVGVNKPEWLK